MSAHSANVQYLQRSPHADPQTRRLKIAHDPNNLTWAQAAESYGQKLLSRQGWKPGQALGAGTDKSTSAAPFASIRIKHKDDNLGLGANLRSEDPERGKTGLDAFQNLLGRLNSKDEAEVKKLDKQAEDKKLARYTQKRLGGILFVSGGVLGGAREPNVKEGETLSPQTASGKTVAHPMGDAETAGKAEKALRREERRSRKKKSRGSKGKCDMMLNPFASAKMKIESEKLPKATSFERQERVRKLASTEIAGPPKKKKNRERDQAELNKGEIQSMQVSEIEEKMIVPQNVQLPTPPSKSGEGRPSSVVVSSKPQTGGLLVRKRHIEAKRMAFTDGKMLDEVSCVFSPPLLVVVDANNKIDLHEQSWLSQCALCVAIAEISQYRQISLPELADIFTRQQLSSCLGSRCSAIGLVRRICSANTTLQQAH